MVRGTTVVNNIHVSDTNMGFESPAPLLWRLPRGGSCCPPPPLSPRSSSVQRGNNTNNNNDGRPMPVDVNDVKGVLRLCFGINKDMVQVIAYAAAVAVASMATVGGLSPGGGGTSTSLCQ